MFTKDEAEEIYATYLGALGIVMGLTLAAVSAILVGIGQRIKERR